MSSLPIGIFDSGVGGLTVLKALLKVLPDENFIYLADTAHVPYGNKTRDTLVSLTTEHLLWMQDVIGVKMAVVACHTSSVQALPLLPAKVTLPVVGMLSSSWVRRCTPEGVLIMATAASIASGGHHDFLRSCGYTGTICAMACPDIVPCLESCDLVALQTCLEQYLAPFDNTALTSLLYGCTHYPLMDGMVQAYLGDSVVRIDPADDIARDVRDLLQQKAMTHTGQKKGRVTFYTTSDSQGFSENVAHWLGIERPLVHKVDKQKELRCAMMVSCCEVG